MDDSRIDTFWTIRLAGELWMELAFTCVRESERRGGGTDETQLRFLWGSIETFQFLYLRKYNWKIKIKRRRSFLHGQFFVAIFYTL